MSEQEGLLDIERQRGGDAVGVDRWIVQPLGFQEDLVAGLSAKRTTLSSMEGQ